MKKICKSWTKDKIPLNFIRNDKKNTFLLTI
jgi:hypothetical protein